jgi:hypothetical protein
MRKQEVVVTVEEFARAIAREQIAGNYDAVKALEKLAEGAGLRISIMAVGKAIRELQRPRAAHTTQEHAVMAMLAAIADRVKRGDAGEGTPEEVVALYGALRTHARRYRLDVAHLPTPEALGDLYGLYDVPDVFNVVEIDLDGEGEES